MTDPVKDISRLLESAEEAEQIDPAKAAQLFEAAAQKAESHLGACHEETLEIRDSWANCLLDAQNHSAAIACNEENLQRRLGSISFGKRHETTLATRRLLADSYLQTKQQAKSVEQYRQVIRIDKEIGNRQTLFEDVLSLVCLLVGWGSETGDRVKISEALETSMKYLEKAEATVPGDHDILVEFNYNIGIQLRHLGKYLEASLRFKQVLVLANKVSASGKSLKNDVLLANSRKWLVLCMKKMEAEIREKERRDTQQEDQLLGTELGMPASVASQALELNTGSTRHDEARKAASSPHSQLRSDRSKEKCLRASEAAASLPSRRIAHISPSHTALKGSPGSKSKSTVRNQNPNPISENRGCNNPSLAEKASADADKRVAERSRSASSLPLSLPEGSNAQLASATPSPRPAEPSESPVHATSRLEFLSLVDSWSNPRRTLAQGNVQRGKRPASAAPPTRSPKVSPTSNSGGFFGSNAWGNESERWFQHLQRNAHRFLRKYHDDEKKITIALLDTGVALRDPSAIEMAQDIQMELCEQVVRGKTLQNRLPPDRDVDGHGSECAYLLTRVTPFARIVSYRIAEKITDDIEPAIVAEALRHAIHGRRQGGAVDIVSMSFGIRPTQDIRDLLTEAKGKGILMFAATSNDGGPRIKFPANSDDVFAIDAANRSGGPSFSNPGAFQKPYRFTALGEILSLRGSMEGSQRSREVVPGSSFATPVAAATAAAILEFARQPPLSYDALALQGLKMLEGMRAVLIHLFSTKKSAGSEFHHINIEHFEPMNNNNKECWDEGGECDEWNSDRYQAADAICKRLKNALDDDCGQAMNDAIAKNHRERWTREAEEQKRRDRDAWEEAAAKQREDEEKKQEDIDRTKREELEKVFKDALERIYPS